MKQNLFNKEKEAIKFIKKAESLAMRMSDKGFHVAFSGGKDSQVLLALMELSGCKYHAEMQVTSVDSPNLMRFVRANYPQVKLNLPKKNMRQLIIQKKLLPTRQARYCCATLKEQAGAGSCTCVGVRAAESSKRANRKTIEVIGQKGVGFDIIGNELVYENGGGMLFDLDSDTKVYCIKGKDKVVISPIFHWSDTDVWDFIALDVCFAPLHQSRRKGANLKCSLLLRKGFIFVLSANLWKKGIMTISNPRNNALNGG